MKVLDTSAIIRSDTDFSDGGYITTSSVLSEILDDGLREIVDIAIGKKHIKVHTPTGKSLETVRAAAKATGDLGVLSPADFDVLAAALEVKATILSDDYAIQNVAAALRVPFERTSAAGIRERISWQRVCFGCGKQYPPDFVGPCPVCGQKTVRKPRARGSLHH